MSYKIHITAGLLGLFESQKTQKDLGDPWLSEFHLTFLASLKLPVKLQLIVINAKNITLGQYISS